LHLFGDLFELRNLYLLSVSLSNFRFSFYIKKKKKY